MAQSAIIVASILLAFAVDAWWAARKDVDKERSHLVALQRDFAIAHDRITSSLEVANQGQNDSLDLFHAIREGRTGALGRKVYFMMNSSLFYEVFSSPRGAYDTIVSAGEVELLQSAPLKLALADFYGGFEDTRVSEQQLLDVVLRFQTSAVFAAKVNWAEIGFSAQNPEAPMGDRGRGLVESWRGDAELYNWLCTLSAHHATVAEDYVFLAERIARILTELATELRRF